MPAIKAPSTSLLRLFSPLLRPANAPWSAQGCLAQQPHTTPFSTTASLLARKKKGGPVKDKKVSLIRYFLQHPRTPRPLRFGRLRALRHWTIHRAWLVYQAKLRADRTLQLERQYNSMRAACEALRHVDNLGLTNADRERIGEPENSSKEVGRLYRIAMRKDRVWNSVPIEYARIQTDTPGREAWNHEWKR